MPVPFNTLHLAETLRDGGFTEAQARALTDALADVIGALATSADLDRLGETMQTRLDRHAAAMKADLDRHAAAINARLDACATKTDLERLATTTKADLTATEARLDHRIDRLERDLKIWFGRMLAWLFGALVAVISLVATLATIAIKHF